MTVIVISRRYAVAALIALGLVVGTVAAGLDPAPTGPVQTGTPTP
jgi:hypothetical protein